MEKGINRRNFIRNLTKVVFSQGLTIFSGVLVGFIIPKILGVTWYGFYRLYTMYFVYTSLLHFGFVDGVLLRYAGRSYSELDKAQMRTLSQFYMAFQGVLALLFIAAGIWMGASDYGFICVMLGLNLFTTNCMAYFQFISQATQRFTEFSLRNSLVSSAKIVICLVLLAMYWRSGEYVSYKLYLILLFIVDSAMLLWYIKTYRDIIFGSRNSLSGEKATIIQLFKTGIILTVAYQVGHLVFVLDRQFVSLLFSRETYSVYSFAYSIISLFATMVATISTVLFPMLKSLTKENVMRHYPAVSEIIALISGAALICFYPLQAIITRFLPEYGDSLIYLRIVFPSLLLSTAISVVGFTYFKILDRNFHYFLFGSCTLLLGVILNSAAYIVVGSPEAISWASIMTLFAWLLGIWIYFWKNYHIPFWKNLVFFVCVLGSYYLISFALNGIWLCAALYSTVFAALALLFYRRRLFTLARQTFCRRKP